MQRGFVWKTTQVRDLIESLWLDYPVGALLIWDSAGPVETRSATDAQDPAQWVVDGQQRTTALCILSGRKPYWWASSPEWVYTRLDRLRKIRDKEVVLITVDNELEDVVEIFARAE